MKRIIAIAVVCACVLLVCTSCKKGEEYPEKDAYNVTMKVVIEGIGEYIFPPDVKMMTVNIPYDGVSRKVYLKAYQYYDHPNKTFRESWFKPNSTVRDSAVDKLGIMDSNGRISVELYDLNEKGAYLYYAMMDPSGNSDIKYRVVELYINVE